MSLTASQAGENSQTNDPEHTIVSSILTDWRAGPARRRGPGTVVIGGPTEAALVGSGPGRVYGAPSGRAAAAAAAPAAATVQTEVRTRAGAVLTCLPRP